MSLELIKEHLEVDREIKRFTTQTIIEENVIVPDYKPDIEKILSIRGDIHVNNKVIEGNKYFVEGLVDFKILYQSFNEGVKLQYFNADLPFSHWVDVEEEGDIQGIIQTRMEYTDFELINGRKLNIRGVLGIQGKFTKREQLPMLTSIKGLEDIQTLPNWIKITTTGEKIKEQTMVKEEVILEDMPPILEIIKTSGRILEKEIKLVDGKIMINGLLEVGIIYIGEVDEDQQIKYVEQQLSFGHFIENPAIIGQMEYHLDLNLKDILTQVKTSEEGIFNTIQIEGIVDIQGTLYKDYEVETIVDAYSPSVQINLERDKVDCQTMILNQELQTSIKENVSTPMGQEGIEDILSMEGFVIITNTQRVGDQWLVEGIVEIEILYQKLGEEEAYECIREEFPFRQGVDLDVKGEIYGDAWANIQHLNYQLLNAHEIEFKIILGIQCQLFKPIVFTIINDIEELTEIMEEESKEAKISVYFKQADDSLWEIAKRYRITIEEILYQNEIADKDNIPDYTPIIISKKDTYTLKK
mgnify:CR=1 FL=1